MGVVLGLEKGTSCGPTPKELWLLQGKMAKYGGCQITKLPSFKVLVINILKSICQISLF